MKLVPLHLKAAREFIRRYHRHSLPTVGGKFALGAGNDLGQLVGVAVCGRPAARHLDDGQTLEVLRVCTDGTRNANSFLYGRARRVARRMGYERVLTYTLVSEGGASLRAAARVEAEERSRPSRRRVSQPVYREDKVRWEW